MNRFVEYIAATYPSQGVMAYSVAPGGVRTEMSMNDAIPEGTRKFIRATGDMPELSAALLMWLVREPRPWLSGRYISAGWMSTSWRV